MKLPSYQPPSRDKVPSAPESAAWIDEYMGPRDQHVKTLTDCLQGQTSVGDNLNAEVRKLSVLHNESTPVTLQKLRGKALGVSLIDSDLDEDQDVSVRMEIKDEKQIRVTFRATIDPGEPFLVTFIVWGS